MSCCEAGEIRFAGLVAALQTAEVAVRVKLRQMAPEMRRAVSAELHVKQFEDAERDIARVLAPLIEEQIQSIAEGLLELEGGTDGVPEQSIPEHSAGFLVDFIFDPREWDDELVNVLLPVMAEKSIEVGYSYLLSLGLDVRKSAVVPGVKTTTASRWLNENIDDLDALTEAMEEAGLPIRLTTEMPTWMKQSIGRHLGTSFRQDYWAKIHETTKGDATKFVRQGLREGWSIDKIARSMRHNFMGDGGTLRYARRRSENIARTEAGNALNGTRKAINNKLRDEMGPQVPMKSTWLSVLGSTTRATHADADGVPENEEGLFDLAGYMIPWPAHFSLPPGERCSCQCTLTMDFGMQDDEALELIQEHEDRIAEREKPTGDEVETRPPEVPEPISAVSDPFPAEERGDERRLDTVRPHGTEISASTDSQGKLIADLVVDDDVLGDSISSYTSEGHEDLNDRLRGGAGPGRGLTVDQEDILTNLDWISSEHLSEPVSVYRGIGKSGPEFLENAKRVLKEGGVIRDPAFLSTSLDPGIAVKFSEKKVLLQIRTSKGAYLEHTTSAMGEHEFLMPRDVDLRVIGIDKKVMVEEVSWFDPGKVVDEYSITVIRLEAL